MNAGQKPVPPAAPEHVSASRRPPAFVIAKSVPYADRIASVVAFPIRDSHRRPSARPHASERGTKTFEEPMTVPRIGWTSAFSSSSRAWIVGSGVTPTVHGRWKSAVR